jgi:hypothetical protein
LIEYPFGKSIWKQVFALPLANLSLLVFNFDLN